MPILLRIWILIALLHTSSTFAQGDRAKRAIVSRDAAEPAWSRTTSTVLQSNAACPSRTANYITHTLPQQCLRTDRISNFNVTIASNASGTVPSGQVSEGNAFATEGIPSFSLEARVTQDASGSVSGKPVETGKGSVSLTPSIPDEPEPSTTLQPDLESDSPLDHAHFLSFEEWKKQNLAKVGQSPENLAGRAQSIDPDRRRPVNNALDTLGEEHEIELDFSGFGSAQPVERSDEGSRSAQGTDLSDYQSSQHQPALRSKDAGTTCKERTNYASFDCAATLLKSNPEAKSGSSILVENKDSYLLNKCAAKNKFLIVELCNDIMIDTVVLANYEFFSSIFRHFRISVSDKYPVKIEKWKDLGTFEARNTREVQAFLIENPLIWARYLRIEFLTHYGSEYYCPVSLLRVHGTTMMDDFRHQEEFARGESQDDEETLEIEITSQAPVDQEPLSASPEVILKTAQAIPAAAIDSSVLQEPGAAHTLNTPQPVSNAESALDLQFTATGSASETPILDQLLASVATCAPVTDLPASPDHASAFGNKQKEGPGAGTGHFDFGSKPHISQALHSSDINKVSLTSTSNATSTPSSVNLSSHSSLITSQTSSSGSSETSSGSMQSPPTLNSTSRTSVIAVNSSDTNTTIHSVRTRPSGTNNTRSSTTASSPHPPQPSTQESFFKSVTKRLSQLESNSTLSLQYIEAQSLILRDAFSKVERRQLNTTSAFLNQINSTIMVELHGFRQAYDQLWQSTVLELDGQREQSQREVLALSSRLTLVADELVWQKRMGVVQSTLLLMCLALILFNRGAGSPSALEIPLLQHMLLKTRSGLESPTEQLSPTERSPMSLFRRKIMRRSTEPQSGDVTDGTDLDSRPTSSDGPVVVRDGDMEGDTEDVVRDDTGQSQEVYVDGQESEVNAGIASPREQQDAVVSPVGSLVRRPSSLPPTTDTNLLVVG